MAKKKARTIAELIRFLRKDTARVIPREYGMTMKAGAAATIVEGAARAMEAEESAEVEPESEGGEL